MSIEDRAREIAAFLGRSEADCIARLNQGFGYQHKCVNDDFRRVNPQTDDELLDWYRTTEEYIWELSAYHEDPGFNYSGMCEGIAARLRTEGTKSVLCLGDGIGDLTLSLYRAGFEPWYHDLADSRTADFAAGRFWLQTDRRIHCLCTFDWRPLIIPDAPLDAVVSLDFLEHVTDVPAWATAIHAALKPGGLFCAQNAFAIGSGPNGSIPCHLERNDRFEKDWDPLLFRLGFRQESSNWYRRG